jgi:predicted GIY-YIG superfamily endonuclease
MNIKYPSTYHTPSSLAQRPPRRAYYVYILRERETQELSYGVTTDLAQWETLYHDHHRCALVYHEVYTSAREARAREQELRRHSNTP